ncbi:MAG: glycosyltransferase [Cyanobacteria bacterium SID2]|nr:glycosyltransferase [Cyanobacteria bacterium SID2]
MKISILMPVFNPPRSFLEQSIESVLQQTHPNWELCISDDASSAEIREILQGYARRDNRIKLNFRPSRGGICRNSNDALNLVTGEFTALLDHDDLLETTAIQEVINILDRHPNTDFIYTDEDKIDVDGNRFQPFHKPNWSPETFLSRMYTCHLGVYRTTLLRELGGFREGFEGSQDYDLVLRLTERTRQIVHLPKILYHWRFHSHSTASGIEVKPHAANAAKRAIEEALQRRKEPGKVIPIPDSPGFHLVRYEICEFRKVSIVLEIPHSGDSLDGCLKSLFEISTYPDFDVILYSHSSISDGVLSVLTTWQIRESRRIRYYVFDNISDSQQCQRLAVEKATGSYVLFFNSTIRLETPDCLEAMVEQAQREEIGAVGVRIVDRFDRIVDAGVSIDSGNVTFLDRGTPNSEWGAFGFLRTMNNVDAVSGLALMSRKSLVDRIQDSGINFCLKLQRLGYRTVSLPHALMSVDRNFTFDRFNSSKGLSFGEIAQNLNDSCYPLIRMEKGVRLERGFQQNAQVFIVTGMHRSGTSLLASFLQNMGIEFGDRLHPADRFNPKGYYEDIDFLTFQRRVLAASCDRNDRGWRDWGWTEHETLDRSKFADYREAARQLIESRSNCPKWGWKDPRSSLMLEFWDDLLPNANYIFIYRYPWDVADSIDRLNAPLFKQNPDYGLRIWEYYNRHMLQFYRNRRDRSILLCGNSIVRHPERFVRLIGEKFNLTNVGDITSQFSPELFQSLSFDAPQVRHLPPQSWERLEELDRNADIPSEWKDSTSYFQRSSVVGEKANKMAAKTPILSIVIPCYNDGEYLEDAIRSVENYPEPVTELLIVNDGSTDRLTQAVLDDLKQRDYHILEPPNRGLAAARNTGIQHARGRYILPLDADNRIRPEYIQKGIEILDRNPQIGVVYGDVEFFGNRRRIHRVPPFHLDILLQGNFIDACAVFRKRVWEECGGYDTEIPEKLGYEDWDFWLSVAETDWEFYHVPEVLFEYRVRSDSMVNACNIPENREKLFHYICNKHRTLYEPRWLQVLVDKESSALREKLRVDALRQQLRDFQSQLREGLGLQKMPLSSQPQVSVCIPTYNGDRFLEEALASVEKQTYSNLEVIISDDGSTDRTVSIVEAFRDNSQIPVRLFQNSHKGMVENWNFSLEVATGKYIKFLFQDDVLSPSCIEAMVEIAESDPEIGFVFAPRILLMSDDADEIPELLDVYQICKDVHRGWTKLEPIRSGMQLLEDSQLMETPINKIGEPTAVLVRKSAFDVVGKFDRSLRQLVDVEMWWRILTRFKVGFVDKPLSYFRLHPRQQTFRHLLEGGFDEELLLKKVVKNPAFPPRMRLEAALRNGEVAGELLLRLLPQIASSDLELLYRRGLRDAIFQGWERSATEGKLKPSSVAKILFDLGIRRFEVSLSEVPEWLRLDYLSLALSDLPEWRDLGEGKRYWKRIRRLTDELHRWIGENPDSEICQEAAMLFSLNVCFTPLYYIDADWENLLVKRWEILEFALSTHHHQLDWEFSEAPSGKAGVLLEASPQNLLFDEIENLPNLTVYSLEPVPEFWDSRIEWVQLPSDLRGQVQRIRRDNLDALLIQAEIAAMTTPITLIAAHQLARFQDVGEDFIKVSSLRWGSLDFVTLNTREFIERIYSHSTYYDTPKLKKCNPNFAAHSDFKIRLGLPTSTSILLSYVFPDSLTAELRSIWATILDRSPETVLIVALCGDRNGNTLKIDVRERISETLQNDDLDRTRVIVIEIDRLEALDSLYLHANLYLDAFYRSPMLGIHKAIEMDVSIVTLNTPIDRAIPQISERIQKNTKRLQKYDKIVSIAYHSNEYIDRTLELIETNKNVKYF